MPELDPIREARRQWVSHGWDEAAPGMEMVTSLVRVHQLLMERIDAVLRPHELTFARYEILRLLAFTRAGALPMTRLGSLLQVHPTSVTNAVDRLQEAGLVLRSPHPTDGRTTLIELTSEGRTLAKRATAVLNSEVFGQSGFEEQDVEQLIRILGNFRRNAGDFSG